MKSPCFRLRPIRNAFQMIPFLFSTHWWCWFCLKQPNWHPRPRYNYIFVCVLDGFSLLSQSFPASDYRPDALNLEPRTLWSFAWSENLTENSFSFWRPEEYDCLLWGGWISPAFRVGGRSRRKNENFKNIFKSYNLGPEARTISEGELEQPPELGDSLPNYCKRFSWCPR